MDAGELETRVGTVKLKPRVNNITTKKDWLGMEQSW